MEIPFGADSGANRPGDAVWQEFRDAFYEEFSSGTSDMQDCQAFVAGLYERHRSQIRIFIHQQLCRARRAGSMGFHVDAEDLCHDTFIRAFDWLVNNIGGKIERPNERAWLCRIASNLVTDTLIRRKEPPSVTLYSEETGEICIPAPGRDPLKTLLGEELKKRLRSCIEKLTEVRRRVLVMVDVDGLTEKEAAGFLNVKIETLRKRLFDGRRQLRDCMDVYFAD